MSRPWDSRAGSGSAPRRRRPPEERTTRRPEPRRDGADRRITRERSDVAAGAALVEAYRAAGRFFVADGVRGFVRSEGDGAPVVLLHGLPTSSYLYRKVLPELADRGLRGVAFDLPGMGLAAHPSDFDYRISGLGAYCAAAVDALDLDSFHLVVHDAGGPVGFELAERVAARIRSLTILNTMVALPSTPFPGELLAKVTRHVGPVVGAPWLWRVLMDRVGVVDRSALSDADVEAHRLLALGDDDGAGYLDIMRAARAARAAAGRSYRWVVDTTLVDYPVQVIWGARDPILSLRSRGMEMLAATRLPSMRVVDGRHYLQEDCAPVLGDLIGTFARSA